MIARRSYSVWTGVALALVALWAYWPTLDQVVSIWFSNPDYSHGILVLPIALWVLWVRRERMPSISQGPHWGGLPLVAFAGVVRFLAGRIYLPQLDAWSLPFWIGGIVWLVFGWRVFRWALPALAFLWFATPLPGTIEVLLSTPLQTLAASLSATALQALGQPALADGTTILLDDQVLDVERACSGLRMFYGISALAFACLVIMRPTLWTSVVILLFAAPIAIVANVARIVVTGLLLRLVSSAAAQKFSHDFAGLVMIPLAALLFAALYVLLQHVAKRYARSAAGASAWLARWAVGIGAILVTLFFWTRYQQERAVHTLRESASRLESEKDHWAAIDMLGRYITARPDDADARVQLAELYGQTAASLGDKRRAVQVTRTAWEYQPDRFDLGLQAARIAYEVNDHRAAISFCDRLVQSTAQDSIKESAIKLKADVLVDLLESGSATEGYTWESVLEALDAAVRFPDFEIRHAAARAEIYLERLQEPAREERRKQADAWMNELVQQRSDDAVAWLTRYEFRRRFADSRSGPENDSADDDLNRALETARQNPGQENVIVLLAAAARQHVLGNSEESVSLLREAIGMAPQDYRPYVALAAVQRRKDTNEAQAEAIATLQAGISACGEGHLPLVLPLASLLAESGDFAGAESTIRPVEEILPHLAATDRSAILLEVGVIRAQILAGRNGPIAGIQSLRQLVNSPDVRLAQNLRPMELARAWAMLGELYGATGASDQAAEAFARCSQIDPDNAAWRNLSAMAAVNAGDWETAERQLQSIVSNQSDNPDSWLALVQIELVRQSQRPASQQNWRRMYELLKRAQMAGVPKPTLILLDSQRRLAQGDAPSAKAILQRATTETPNDAALWNGLAVACDAAGDRQGALDAAARYAMHTNNSPGAQVLQAALLAKLDRADEAQLMLERALGQAKQAERSQLAEALARHHLQHGERATAIQVLEEAHRAAPSDLQTIDTLANVALLASDWSAHEKYEQWLRSAEGNAGTLWRAHRAERLLLTEGLAADGGMDEAVRLCQALDEARPTWWKTNYLQGEIALRTNQEETALAAYERAWSYGGRNIVVADRLIDLLTRRGRFDDAQRFVGQIDDILDRSSQLFDRALPWVVKGEQGAKAIQIAEEWARLRPNDALARIRLGRVLMLLAQNSNGAERDEQMRRAETQFLQAIKLAPTDVRPWIAAVTFYGQSTGSREKALTVLDRFSDQVEIEPLSRSYILGQLYEGLGMPAESLSCYLDAVNHIGDSKDAQLAAEVLVRTARFYLVRDPSIAERFARQATHVQPSSREAKQLLVQALAEQHDVAALNEAFRILAELQSNAPSRPNAFQIRLQADLFARREGPGDSERAIALLGEIVSKSPDDKLRLARLYEESGRLAPAFELLDELTRAPTPRAEDLAEFLRFWQSNFLKKENSQGTGEQFSAKAQQVYQLLGGMPGQRIERLRWKLREIKARSEMPTIDAESARAVLTPLLDELQLMDSETQRQQLLQVAFTVLISEDAGEAAVQLADNPPGWIDRRDAIIQLCVAAIIAGPGTADAAVKQLFRKAVQEMNDDVDLLTAVADYRYISEDYAGAVQAYRQAVAADPRRVAVLNNLALVLAEQDGGIEKAAEIVNRAVAIDPDDVNLLDTKASLALIERRPQEALEILDQIADRSVASPHFHLHKSIAYDMLGQTQQSQLSYFKAIGLNIEQQLLAPRDRQYLETIRRKQSVAGRMNTAGDEIETIAVPKNEQHHLPPIRR